MSAGAVLLLSLAIGARAADPPSSLEPPPAAGTGAAASDLAPGADAPAGKATDAADALRRRKLAKPKSAGKARSWFRLLALGGANLFSSADVNTLFNMKAMRNGVSGGGELALMITESFFLVARGEYVAKEVIANVKDSSTSYVIRVRSFPIEGGIGIGLIRFGPIAFEVDALGGIGAATSFSAQVGGGAPSSFSANVFAFHGLGRIALVPNRHFWFFAEGGYRYARSNAHYPTLGDESDVFKKNGSTVALSVDLSGPVIGGGLGVAF